MQITAIRTRAVPIGAAISNAYVDFSRMTCSIVAVVTDRIVAGRPVVGYAFSSNGRYDVDGLLQARFVPRLMEADPSTLQAGGGDSIDPVAVRRVLMTNEKPGGHGERAIAVAVLEAAVWDAIAKAEDEPLWVVLARYFGVERPESTPRVKVYAAGGYYAPGKTIRDLQDEVRVYLDAGYLEVKIKVGGASVSDDLRRIEAVLELVGAGENLAVDANARLDLPAAIDFANAISGYELRWFEEPGDPTDFELQARLRAHYSGAFAVGENLFGAAEARNLLRYANLDPHRDWVQFDPLLGYGLVEYVDTLRLMSEHGWSWDRCIPHGGHQLALHLAAALGLGGNEAYPGVFGAFGGFADGCVVEDGWIAVPDTPGVGFESKKDLMAVFKTLVD